MLNKLVICGGSSAVSPGLEKADIWVQAVLAWHASAGMRGFVFAEKSSHEKLERQELRFSCCTTLQLLPAICR